MKERASIVVSIFILTLLVMGTWWAADYSQRAVQIDPPSRLTHERDTWAKKIVLVRTNDKGIVIHRLEGDLMEHFPDDKSYELQASNVAFIYDEGDRIIMRGGAVLLRLGDTERQPLNFRSEEITLLVDKDLAYTDLPAVATSGRSKMSGVGMRFNNATQQLDVLQSTDVDIAPKDQREGAEPPAQ